jgi:NAD(P)-dependent dehydrogenase (short-subunit alcohol dehydrogenase family)
VTNYADIYNLFKVAHDKYKRVDHAVSCAGILERGAWFDPKLTIDTVSCRDGAPTSVLDVNVVGSANFARVAVVFLRNGFGDQQRQTDGLDKSLVLLSSVNAFRESPGLYMYQVSSFDSVLAGCALRWRLQDPEFLGEV